MQVKVRNQYGFTWNATNHVGGDIIDIPEEEYNKRPQVFEIVVKSKEAVKEEIKVEDLVEEKKEDTIPQNRAILDSVAGKAIIRRGSRLAK